MAASVAVIADVHGVLPALEAVLAEPDVVAAERLVSLGDVAAGPEPGAVLDRLMALGDRVVWIMGNADREMVEHRRGARIGDPITRWAASQLSDHHVARLASQRRSLTLRVDGLGKILFCHATPRRDDEAVRVDASPARWTKLLRPLPADIDGVACGHTHMPFARLASGRLVINPGSVGMPYGRAGAHWALLGPGVGLRRTPFDVEAACAAVVARSGYPNVAAWVHEVIRSPATDAEAIAALSVAALSVAALSVAALSVVALSV